jgi:hypothetical protein
MCYFAGAEPAATRREIRIHFKILSDLAEAATRETRLIVSSQRAGPRNPLAKLRNPLVAMYISYISSFKLTASPGPLESYRSPASVVTGREQGNFIFVRLAPGRKKPQPARWQCSPTWTLLGGMTATPAPARAWKVNATCA